MRVVILDNYEEVSRWAALHIAERIRESAAREPAARGRRAKPFVLGLPTGSTPLGTYRELIRLCGEKKVSFENVVTFNMDEYLGLGEDHPQSYRRFMMDNFFNHVDMDKKNIHTLNGLAQDSGAECLAYEEAIRAAGGIELFLGGMGSDGHLAFNEPGSSLSSRTRVKTLTGETRIANARFFGGDPQRVPATALTVGVGTVMDAREVLVLVSGYQKARALRAVVEEGINHMWTLSCLQMHQCAIIVCDREATDELKVRTVRYFRDIERRP
ncbi:MAG: glucosamine-6-phosphate deaminase [Treponema sp.]|nr:glucosamine-6-phosphate deaminase [Treponema sp.]